MKAYIDGASRGNPGKSSCAYILVDDNNKKVDSKSFYIGDDKTNNQAEYTGLIKVLESLIDNIEISIFSDSSLVINQMKGLWKVKNKKLKKLYLQVVKIIKDKNLVVRWNWIRRDEGFIPLADNLCNEILDKII